MPASIPNPDPNCQAAPPPQHSPKKELTQSFSRIKNLPLPAALFRQNQYLPGIVAGINNLDPKQTIRS